MQPKQSLQTIEEMVAYVLVHYWNNAHRLSGPTEAVREVFAQLRKRRPAALGHQLELEGLAQRVSKASTGSRPLGWSAAAGTLSFQYLSEDTHGAAKSVDIPFTRVAWNGPTAFDATEILGRTYYATANTAKSLLEFSVDDFVFCIDGYEDERDGIERHIEVMELGIQLLKTNNVAMVKDLPKDALEAFAQRWSALKARRKASDAAAD
jgi:hypothetical protein